MIDSKELLYIVDENNNPLEPQLRSNAHKNGLWHRTTGIWAINKKNQVLCQKRSLKKDVKPGFWEAFFGGHLAQDEDYKHNAIQESNEELGVKINQEDLIPYKVLKSDKPTHKEFQYVFALLLNKEISELHFEKEEIDQLKWIDLEGVRKILTDTNIDDWVKKPWDEEVLNWLETL
jgi:isopentenyl-diphosphate Delta-isomerase